MAILVLLASLISLVFGSYYYQQSPCDCFSVNLMYGYPKVTGGEVCYRYLIHKKDYSCRMNLDYYILSAYVIHHLGSLFYPSLHETKKKFISKFI